MKNKQKGYKDLVVWQKAMELVLVVYGLTTTFPSDEQYGLSSQIKRSAVSIPSNIAEGSKRGTTKDFHHFLIMAYGSGAELETQVSIAKNLSFGKESDYTNTEDLLDEVMRMLNTLVRKTTD